jgi:methionyl-tRNA formyltransferase
MGTPEFAVAPLERLAADGYDVAAVYTQPDRPAGRGRSLAASPAKRAAVQLGLPVEQPESLKGSEAAARLANLAPDVIVVAAYGLWVPKAVLDIPALGYVNIHPSLLPRYRGVSPVQAAILSGDTFTGVSIMQLDEGWDTGPVLGRAQIPVWDRDTGGSLTEKLSLVGAGLLLDVLPRLARKEIVPEPQDEAAASYCRAIRKEAGEIDWSLPAADIARRVRAYNPWPACRTRWDGRLLRILEVTPTGEGPGGEAGTVVASRYPGAGFGVVAGDGVLGVLKVQAEGKRPMSAADFLRGQPHLLGAVLPDAGPPG